MSKDKKIKVITIKTDNYAIENLEYYFTGDLKGYANGIIEFSNGKTHELLFRFYDPENGGSNELVSIDYGYENPMVSNHWNEIETKITKAVSGFIESSLQGDKVSISADQALTCLKYSSGKLVHSFTNSVFLSGADIDFVRVEEILKGAASVNMLFINDKLGKSLNYSIAAYDHLYQEWIYLECIPEKISELHEQKNKTE